MLRPVLLGTHGAESFKRPPKMRGALDHSPACQGKCLELLSSSSRGGFFQKRSLLFFFFPSALATGAKTLQPLEQNLPSYLLGNGPGEIRRLRSKLWGMVCTASCPMLVNAGCSARPALHARARASSCVARSSSEYPSSSWPRGRVDTSTSVQVHALASTLARETEALTECALSEAELVERRRLLEGSYLAETAPEPASIVCLRADLASPDGAPGVPALLASCAAELFPLSAGGCLHQLVGEGFGERGCSEHFSRGRPVWNRAGPVGGQLAGLAIAVHKRKQEAGAPQDGTQAEGAPALGSGCVGGHAGGRGRSATEASEARTAAGPGAERVSGLSSAWLDKASEALSGGICCSSLFREVAPGLCLCRATASRRRARPPARTFLDICA